MCYTYDNLSKVTARTVKKLSDNSVVSTETFNYDAAGNVTSAPDISFQYDTNNRLISFNGNTVSYDLDGNMLSNGSLTCTYDSANRLVSAGGSTYTYNAEDVRIRQYRYGADTTYVYDTNCKLSKLLCKTTNGIVTKYVYGLGLIGEEKESCFKTYHFDSRGSTIAITNENGTITDTFAYDTYGKVTSHVGSSFVIFGYNGRDGVVTDDNGLIYMRARYYSPDMKRFINADIIAGSISNAVTLNRFAYANGNPVSFVDPFGLSAEDRSNNHNTDENEVMFGSDEYWLTFATFISDGLDCKEDVDDLLEYVKALDLENAGIRFVKAGDFYYIRGDTKTLARYGIQKSRVYTHKVGKYKSIAKLSDANTIWKSGLKEAFDAPGVILDTVGAVAQAYVEASQYDEQKDKILVGGYTFATEMASSAMSTVASVGTTAAITKACATAGTFIAPGVGTVVGLVVGMAVGYFSSKLFGWIRNNYINDIVENN